MDDKDFEVTSKAYKRWLTQQTLNDARSRSMGITPVPRSREEELAMYYNAHPGERRSKMPKRLRPL
jgi:hypothetical protein